MNSDNLTTQYMDRMRHCLEVSSGKEIDDCPFLEHYSSSPIIPKYTPSPGVQFVVPPEPDDSNMLVPKNIHVKSRLNVSDRNLLCMRVKSGDIVVGGADHGLRVIKMSNGVLKTSRTLYSKKFGHSDWVTAVETLNDGRIVSGGMDSKICVWRGVQCKDLIGHVGSISAIKSLGESHILSSSYDRSLKVWDANKSTPNASLHGHNGAIIDFILPCDNTAVSAGRDGNIIIWDLYRAVSKALIAAHTGHVTSLSQTSHIIVSGGHDGLVKFWDTRSHGPIHEDPMADGRPITIIDSDPQRNRIVTVSANSVVSIFDCRKMDRVHTWTEPDTNHIYSTRYLNGGVLIGTGNGKIVTRAENGIETNRIQVDQNAIRCIQVDKSGNVVVATDDGNVITL